MPESCNCGSSSLGSYLGTVGGQIGDRATAWGEGLAMEAKKRFKNWTGLGDYRINTNSLIAGGGEPVIFTAGRATRIHYREYLGELVTGPVVGGFHATTFVVNPANSVTFPWLSNIARNYDQYVPAGIIFEFKSTATDSTTASASLGSVMIATEYDVLDSAPTSKSEMMNSAYSSEAKCSESMLHGIECEPTETQRKLWYTRHQDQPVSDVRDYDFCHTTFATIGGGLPANQSIGSIYVHYEFVFYKEQIPHSLTPPPAVSDLLTGYWYGRTNIGRAIGSPMRFQDIFGSSTPTCTASGPRPWTNIQFVDQNIGFPASQLAGAKIIGKIIIQSVDTGVTWGLRVSTDAPDTNLTATGPIVSPPVSAAGFWNVTDGTRGAANVNNASADFALVLDGVTTGTKWFNHADIGIFPLNQGPGPGTGILFDVWVFMWEVTGVPF